VNKCDSVPIGELCTVSGGGTPVRNNPSFYGGPVPWVTPKDMKSWEISGSQVTLTESGLANSAAKLVAAESILIVVRSGVLKHSLPIALNRVPVAINQDMKSLSCGARLDSRYCARFLKSQTPVILRWVRATTADNFPIEKLLKLRIPLPPLSEQRRIAEILDKADALRAKRRAALAQLDTLTQSIFLDMFGDPESEGWHMTTVGSIGAGDAAIRTGPFGSQLLHGEFVDEGVAVLGIDNAVENEFRWSQRRFITAAKYRSLSRYTVHPGDVLITLMGTCGRCAVVPNDVPLAINTKHLCCITVDRAKCLPEFLHSYFLLHPIAQRYLRQTAKGAIMDGLNMGIIKEMPIPVAPIGLQERYTELVWKQTRLKNAAFQSASELDALFASLQHRAFRGEL